MLVASGCENAYVPGPPRLDLPAVDLVQTVDRDDVRVLVQQRGERLPLRDLLRERPAMRRVRRHEIVGDQERDEQALR
jgi:hypothetical protein